MANDLNQCSFIGRLGANPEVKYLPSGEPVANVRLACGKKWKNKQTGQPEERTEWITCVMFGKLAEMIGSYWQKGTQVFVQGEVRTRKWQDQSGQDRYSTEFVIDKVQTLKDGKNDTAQPKQQPASQNQPANGFDFPDDDLPF
jgi:single-strand DNA-binding protein